MKIESVLLRLLLPGLETENFSKVKDLKTTNIDINTMTIIIITIHDDDDQPASLLTEHASIPIGKSLAIRIIILEPTQDPE